MFVDLYRAEHVPLGTMAGIPYPQAFSHPRLEYEAITHAVALLDLSHVGVLRLTGSDRVRFLNAMVTNDVAALATGTACQALVTTTKGRVVAELLVLARAQELLVLVTQGSAPRVVDALESHIIADDVTLENLSGEFGVLAVEGPKCRDLVWRIFPREPLPLERLKFTENEYQGMRATVIRHSVTGEKGLLVIVDRGHIERMRDYLVQGGVGMDARPAGRVAWNLRRMEGGLPWFEVDVTEDNFPAEARLETHVSYEKGCYLGQETIARMHYRGHPNWLLVGLTTADDAPASLGYPPRLENLRELPVLANAADDARADSAAMAFEHTPVAGVELFTLGNGDVESYADDVAEGAPAYADTSARKPVGRLTCAALSPLLKRALFLGYVRASLAQAGTQVRGHLGGMDVTLTVVDLPLTRSVQGDVSHA
jgi:folate-binding protein YgfZ